MSDTDLCSGLFCPLKRKCKRYLSIPQKVPRNGLLWWVEPSYNVRTKKCKLYLKEKNR